MFGTNGIVTTVLKENLEVVPGKLSVDSQQRRVVPGMSHVIQKVLQSET
jgi:hypothetical protein